MIKVKKVNKYELKDFEHVGDMQEVPFSLVKSEENLRSYISAFAKEANVKLACAKSSTHRHFKIIRKS